MEPQTEDEKPTVTHYTDSVVEGEWLDKLDAEIMDWFYETCKINFGVEDMAQDSSELRDILKSNITFLLLTEREEVREELKKVSLDILEEHFPKQNQKDTRFPSPNGHGAVIAYRGLLLAKLSTHND